MKDDRELLLYIVAKVARLDAVVSSIHAMVHNDLMPADQKLLIQRKWLIQQTYNGSILAEKEHLKNQFPDDYSVLEEHIDLAEKEGKDATAQLVSDILEGRIDIPEEFQPDPDQDQDHDKNEDGKS